MRARVIASLFVLVAAPACAARVPHTQPEDMSAQAHLSEAAHHRDEAAIAAQQVQRREHAAHDPTEPHAPYWYSYSYHWDTDRWIEEAEGKEHLAAAQALEREYTFACALIPQEQQAISPIDVYIEGVEREGGRAVLVHLSPAAGPPEELLHHLRCHRARMAYYGLGQMRDCALGVNGLSVIVRAVPSGMDVTLTPRDPAALPELERRARLSLARVRRVPK